jgi:hypothetical protein
MGIAESAGPVTKTVQQGDPFRDVQVYANHHETSKIIQILHGAPKAEPPGVLFAHSEDLL